jgi:hypothetical protein
MTCKLCVFFISQIRMYLVRMTCATENLNESLLAVMITDVLDLVVNRTELFVSILQAKAIL